MIFLEHGFEPRPPLLARSIPPVLRGASAALDAARGSARLPRAGLVAADGVGRARVETAGLAGPARRRVLASILRETLAELAAVQGLVLERSGALPEAPAVVVANHVSYLDPVMLGQLAPCAPVAKREVADWPVVGGGARALGAIFVDRDDPRSGARALREALRCLEAGVSVLCFPEGTTTRGDELLPFRRGLFGAARLAGVPIVPVALRYDDPSLCWVGDAPFLPHYLRTTARRRSVATARIGRPIDACASRTAGELAAIARDRIAALLRG